MCLLINDNKSEELKIVLNLDTTHTSNIYNPVVWNDGDGYANVNIYNASGVKIATDKITNIENIKGSAGADTIYGKTGVKVWIYKGEVLPAKKNGGNENDLDRR